MIWDERYGDAAEPPPLDQGGDPIHYTLHKFLYERSIALPTTGRTDGCIVCDVGERFLNPAAERVLALGAGMAIIKNFCTAGTMPSISLPMKCRRMPARLRWSA